MLYYAMLCNTIRNNTLLCYVIQTLLYYATTYYAILYYTILDAPPVLGRERPALPYHFCV